MSDRSSVLSRLASRSEEVLTQLAGELMANPHFARAVQQALKGKAFLDEAAARALKQANIPTRSEFKRALRRIEGLEAELERLRERLDEAEKAKRKRPTAKKRPRGKGARVEAAG